MMIRVKQFVCLCLSVLILAAAVPSVMAAGTPAFAVSTVSGRPGETVSIAVSLENNPGIVGVRLRIHYDTNVLELIAADGMEFPGTIVGPLTKMPFTVTWVDALQPNNTTNGALAILTFRIKDQAPAGLSPITLAYNAKDVIDQDLKPVTFATGTGGVTVGGTAVVSDVAHSVLDSTGGEYGLAFRFSLPARGLKANTRGTADLSGATVSYQNTDCPLVRMGALLTTDSAIGTNTAEMLAGAAGVTDVRIPYVCEQSADGWYYALRVLNIPSTALGATIYARPYYVVTYQGVETVVYGTIDATTYTAQTP